MNCPLNLRIGERACFQIYPINAPIPEGWTDEGIVPAHHAEFSRLIRLTETEAAQ